MKILRLFPALLLLAGPTARVHAADEAPVLIPLYEKASAALCADDVGAARTAARELAGEAARRHCDAIGDSAKLVAAADDLPGARRAFKDLSVAVIALAKPVKGYFILNCPMAGADWLQRTRAVANPYFGRAMPTCGSVKAATGG